MQPGINLEIVLMVSTTFSASLIKIMNVFILFDIIIQNCKTQHTQNEN